MACTNNRPEGLLVGIESRSSGCVRIPRDEESRGTREFPNLFPVGEGAGYAGGIVTAAVDGLQTAKKIVEQFTPLEMGATYF